jgi:N-carbamoyl-L-amino-acid hydrolase
MTILTQVIDEYIATGHPVGSKALVRAGAVDASASTVRYELSELEARGLPQVEVPSGAGHDAGILAAAGVRSALLFVRSLAGGVSHSPDEYSSAEDVAVAIDVLAGTLARLG